MAILTGSEVNVFFENAPAEFSVVVTSTSSKDFREWIFQRADGTQVVVDRFCKIEEVKLPSV